MTTMRNEAQIRAVLAELATGATNQQVASKLGLTRNAVIGIAYRHGDSSRRRTKAQANHERYARERIAERREKRQEPPKRLPKPKATLKPAKPGGIPLEALTDNTCRWPITDKAPHRFCGCQTAGGVYCEAHTRLASRGQG